MKHPQAPYQVQSLREFQHECMSPIHLKYKKLDIYVVVLLKSAKDFLSFCFNGTNESLLILNDDSATVYL